MSLKSEKHLKKERVVFSVREWDFGHSVILEAVSGLTGMYMLL